MKAKLVPVYFKSGMDEEYNAQLKTLKRLLEDVAEIAHPVPLEGPVPRDADAILFPQLLGDAYKQLEDIRKFSRLPLLIVTSEFGTFSMWDWEIISFLNDNNIKNIAPYNIEQTKIVCRALIAKKKLSQSKFIVYQDRPGEGGMQDEIFKRFYWWQERCVNRMKDKFGIVIEKRSFKELGKRAKEIPNTEAEEVLRGLTIDISEDLSRRALLSAIKLYIAIKRDLEKESSVIGVGINCLNESKYSDTTPCLAWCLLYEEKGILWACEADIVSLLTKYLMHETLKAPVMMSNIYPFLMGQAALKHERIPNFPEIVDEPENHILVAHCGYMGLIPKSFSTQWTLRPRVLGIVNENAHVVDARLPTGSITLVKINSTLSKIMVIEGIAKGYVQYPGSDCRNGLIVKVRDGHEVVKKAYSHHQIFLPGHYSREIKLIGDIMDLEVEVI